MIFSTLEHILTHISFSIISIVLTIYLITFLVDEIVKLYDSFKMVMIINLFSITGLLVTRWIYSEHFPLSDLYESLIFPSWSFFFIYIVRYFKKNKNILSTIIGPSAIFTQGFATLGFLTEIHKSTILVPALQSEWLIMHASTMILGYAVLLCGSLLSVSLIVVIVTKNKRFFVTSNHFINFHGSFFFGEIEYLNEQSNVFKNTYFLNYYMYQLIQQFDLLEFTGLSPVHTKFFLLNVREEEKNHRFVIVQRTKKIIYFSFLFIKTIHKKN